MSLNETIGFKQSREDILQHQFSTSTLRITSLKTSDQFSFQFSLYEDSRDLLYTIDKHAYFRGDISTLGVQSRLQYDGEKLGLWTSYDFQKDIKHTAMVGLKVSYKWMELQFGGGLSSYNYDINYVNNDESQNIYFQSNSQLYHSSIVIKKDSWELKTQVNTSHPNSISIDHREHYAIPLEYEHTQAHIGIEKTISNKKVFMLQYTATQRALKADKLFNDVNFGNISNSDLNIKHYDIHYKTQSMNYHFQYGLFDGALHGYFDTWPVLGFWTSFYDSRVFYNLDIEGDYGAVHFDKSFTGKRTVLKTALAYYYLRGEAITSSHIFTFPFFIQNTKHNVISLKQAQLMDLSVESILKISNHYSLQSHLAQLIPLSYTLEDEKDRLSETSNQDSKYESYGGMRATITLVYQP